jgi:hypothetical protein
MPEPTFYERADDHIRLSNDQLRMAPGPDVASSMTFGSARFNTWLLANQYGSKEELTRRRDEAIRLLADHYAEQLATNFDDYIENFDKYVRPGVITR